jgi:hypothetical protein
MVESILDNEAAINAALIRTGNRDSTITPMEKCQLNDLVHFLQPFYKFTTMVSGNLPHNGYVTLIKHEIHTLCKIVQRDSSILKELKRLVLLNVGRRLPDSDVVRLATLMDPCMKDAIDMTHEQKVSN